MSRIIVNDTISKKMYFNGIPFWSVGDPTLLNPLCPFYIEAVGGDASVKVKASGTSLPTFDLQYSSDLQTWTSISINDDIDYDICVIPSGSMMFFRASTNAWGGNNIYRHFNVVTDGTYNIGGNITSLLYGSEFNGQRGLKATFSFPYLFSGESKLRYAISLLLTDNLYMDSYKYFFANSGLINGPSVLPGVSLIGNDNEVRMCYAYMYYGCSSLTKAPEIMISKVSTASMSNMFAGCYALTYVPDLHLEIINGDRPLGNMFKDCTALTKAPYIPNASILRDKCFQGMFARCSSLSEVRCGIQGTITENMMDGWLSNVAATGIFYKNADSTWPTGASGIPSGWTIENL